MTRVLLLRTDAPGRLQRINQAAELTEQNTGDLTLTYSYDYSAGEGVDIYIIDTYQYLHESCTHIDHITAQLIPQPMFETVRVRRPCHFKGCHFR